MTDRTNVRAGESLEELGPVDWIVDPTLCG